MTFAYPTVFERGKREEKRGGMSAKEMGKIFKNVQSNNQ